MNEEFKGTFSSILKAHSLQWPQCSQKILLLLFLRSSVALFQKGFFALESRQKMARLTTGVDKVEANAAKRAFRFDIEGGL